MHSLEGSRVETGNIFAVALRVAVEKMVCQKVDVLAAGTEGRDVNLDGIQAKEEILPEPASSSLRIYVRIRSREHSHVDAPGAGRTYTLKVPRFQNAQKFCLQIQRNVGNFIQKKCAAIRQFETPDAVSARIRKSSLYVTEELAFENALRQSARIYSHHWLPPPSRPRAHPHCDAAPRGHHDNGQRTVEHLNAREQVETLLPGSRAPRVIEVHQRRVKFPRFNGAQRLRR